LDTCSFGLPALRQSKHNAETTEFSTALLWSTTVNSSRLRDHDPVGKPRPASE